MNYLVDSCSDRYGKNLMVVEGEDGQDLACEALTDMVSVEVIPPWDRKDPDCKIHGQISVKFGQSDVPVILFSRGPDDPALVLLSLPGRPDSGMNHILLPDGDSPPPPLQAILQSNPIRFTMKLYERKISGEDELIADVKDLEHGKYALPESLIGMSTGFHVTRRQSGSKFSFSVTYAVMWGARAEIEVKINPQMGEGEGEGEGGGAPIPKKPKSTVLINAEIEAIQNNFPSPCGQSSRTLYSKSEEVNVGDKLKLQPSIVCLPMGLEQFLTILVRPDRDDKANYILLDFPFEMVGRRSFRTNKQFTHTKDVPGTRFSVSIKILPSRENLSQQIKDCFECPTSSWLDDGDLLNLFEQVLEGPEGIVVGEVET